MTTIEFGATYRDTETGFVGVAQPPDTPITGKTYRLADGIEAVSVGPYPPDPDQWIVTIGDEPTMIDRGDLPLMWPQIGIQGPGPKGAPERRYFHPDRLQKVDA